MYYKWLANVFSKSCSNDQWMAGHSDHTERLTAEDQQLKHLVVKRPVVFDICNYVNCSKS